MMFSEDWNLEELNKKAELILQGLEAEGWSKYIVLPATAAKLPASREYENAETIVIVCSGWPEVAGVWAYSLLEESTRQNELLDETTMAPYFRDLPGNVGLIILNPHAEGLKTPPDASIPNYLSQLEYLYQTVLQPEKQRIVLLGYSLGGEVILRFLQKYSGYAEKTNQLIFIDPTPPSIGRRKLNPIVLILVEKAIFYGLSDQYGHPGEFAEFTKMRLRIQPTLVPCDSHGAMPNLIWPRLQKELQTLQG
jgi:pimeloyl-ACP methyl ester carboxylesterase